VKKLSGTLGENRIQIMGLSLFTLFSSLLLFHCSDGLSTHDPDTSSSDGNLFSLSRRDAIWKVPLGATLTYGYGKLVYNALSVQDISYPAAHEERVQSTIYRTLLEAPVSDKMLRVLEVGIGADCRVLRRGLYNKAFDQLAKNGIQQVELTGVDLKLPKERIVQEAQERASVDNLQLDLNVINNSITTRLSFPNDSFDAIICCLTLCSVDDQPAALQEMKRLLRPDGGTLGFVEHVAVNEDEPYRFLEWQQKTLDPLQQALADNCHLHRYTERTISDVFDDATFLQRERFLVDSMWPVSSQCCGVIQRTTI